MPGNISTLCSLLGYSRQALYQGHRQQQLVAYKQELLLQQVHIIRSQQKRLGGRKLLSLLNGFLQDHNISIGRDAFFKLLDTNGLLVRKRKRGKPITTDSYHRLKKYKNIIKDFIPGAANQLWVSDITYIDIEGGFAYLSLITDAYSRKIVGYDLYPNLSATGSLRALKMALQGLPAKHNIIHHSDRGIQYCCNDYTSILNQNNIAISMTEKGDPLENAIAERVNGILKSEFLDQKFKDFNDARMAINDAISIYNTRRPHSSINYLTPVAAHAQIGALKRRWKNYYKSKTTIMTKT